MKKNFVNKMVACALLFAAFNSSSWAAEDPHQHDGDIQPWLANGKIQLNSTLFEPDFGDLGGGLYKTDDPGFDVDTAKGAFEEGNWLRYEGMGTLKFWNGSNWSTSLVNGEEIRIEDALGNTTVFDETGVTNAVGVVDAFDEEGGVHTHIDFSIWDGTGQLGGTVGAYWVMLKLFDTLPNDLTRVSEASDTINLIFNRGLDHEDYEAAAEAAEALAAVPVPAAVYLFISALFGLQLTRAGKQKQ